MLAVCHMIINIYGLIKVFCHIYVVYEDLMRILRFIFKWLDVEITIYIKDIY